MKKAIIVIIVLLVIGLIIWGYSVATVPKSPAPDTMNMSSAEQPATTTQTTQPATTQTAQPAQTSSAVSVDIAGYAFSPSALTVKKGTTVTWTNRDTAPHTVTGDNGGPASGELKNGGTYSYTFNTTGTFAYHCTVHPSMKATVTVTE